MDIKRPTFSRRRFLQSSPVAAAAGLLSLSAGRVGAAGLGDRAIDDADGPDGPRPNVVLVHGAWADGSSWSGVIRLLQDRGFPVFGVQLALASLAEDVATTRRFVGTLSGPVVLVGHSYGGAVIGGAGFGLPSVTSLVYVAAFAPEEGESLGQLLAQVPPLPSMQDIAPDPAGFLFIRRDRFREDFAADVPRPTAEVMAAVQKPIFGGVLGEASGPQAWHAVPSFYQVSDQDRMLSPALQRTMAARIGARTIALRTSHASLVSAPAQIARLIRQAAAVSAV
jgi:pimeloyl-ACP methyl ester carboxylesterase